MPVDATERKVMCIALVETYKTSRVKINKIIWVNESLPYMVNASDEDIIKETENDYYRIDDLFTEEKVIRSLFEWEGMKW